MYAPLGPLSPIGSLLLVKFIEVATAEPKFEEPPVIRIVTIYYKQTNRIISSSAENVIVCIPLSEQESMPSLFTVKVHACTYEHTHNFHVL